MSKKKTTVVFYYISIFLLLVFSFSAFGQGKSSELQNKRISIKMDKQPLGVVLGFLMKNYNIPIGFEEASLDKDHSEYMFDTNFPTENIELVGQGGTPKITLKFDRIYKADKHPISVNFENEKLKDVLNNIIGQMGNYEWEINNEVVNIFPIKGRDQRFLKLMETKIDNFTFEKDKTINDILTKIKDLPEIKRFTLETRFNLFGHRAGIVDLPDDRFSRIVGVEMNFSNLTFRELLNKITKVKRGGWILRWGWFSDNPRAEFFVIDI